MKKEKVQGPRFIEVMPKGLTPTYVQPIRFYLKGEKVVGTDKKTFAAYTRLRINEQFTDIP